MLAMQLHERNTFPGAKEKLRAGFIRTTFLDATAAKAMMLDGIDRAHCDVH